jgi:ankyrin repeat protein
MKHLLLTTIPAVVRVGCGTPARGISIHDAVKEGKIDVVKQRLEAGTDVNEKGWAPLHLADKKEIAELLIAKGADLNAKIESAGILKGYTPLDVADEFNLPELASILRKHGGKTSEELKAEGKEPTHLYDNSVKTF